LRLGLRGLARAVAGAVVTLAVALAAFALTTVAGAVDVGPSWAVTVGPASQTLFPGTQATMPYEVRNATSGSQRLHATTVEVKTDGVGVYDGASGRYVDACPVQWFRVTGHDVATDLDLAPGASVRGTIALAFDDAGVSEHACESLDIDVVVNAS
jgi:hypothetical protein